MTTTEDRGARKTREGIVVSDKMDKTVTVQVSDRVAHGTYSKVLSRSRKLKAHDEANCCWHGRSCSNHGNSTNLSNKALACSRDSREG